jgi:two-component system response regulator AtoC
MSDALLIVEDEAVLAKNIRKFFERAGYEARVAGSAEEALVQLDSFRPDAVLLDFQLPGIDGLELLALLRSREPKLPVVMLTGQGSVELAVRALKLGAVDFLSKPVALEHLRVVVDRLLEERRAESAAAHARARQASGMAAVIGESAPMRALKERIARLLAAEGATGAGTPPAVLVSGETGTGKELLARALHAEGLRRDGPFVEARCVTLDCASLEAELFGCERGAFPGATERRLGLVEAAHGGTLFIDEVAELPGPVQDRLLRLLTEGTLRRLGATREQAVDVRVIAASSGPLDTLIAAGRFRADLDFRLRGVALALPPLRERGEDVVLLARVFVDQLAARYRKGRLMLSRDAETALCAYSWPGNVRELRNLIEQTVLLAGTPVIEAAQLALPHPPVGTAAAPDDADADFPTLQETERNLLLGALQKTRWNVTQAAELLGISRDTLRYRIDKHRLSRSS